MWLEVGTWITTATTTRDVTESDTPEPEAFVLDEVDVAGPAPAPTTAPT
jgi:hypothetical protein